LGRRHTLEELAQYAAGVLSEADHARVAAHIGGCAACRQIISLGEAVGGILLESGPGAEIGPLKREQA